MYTSLIGFSSLGSVNVDMPTGTLSAILRESKLSVVGFLLFRVSTLLQRFFLSEPFDVPLMEFPPLGAQTQAYGLPSSAPVVFFCRSPFIHILMRGIPPCSGDAIHILMLGFPLLGRQVSLWVFPTRRSTPLLVYSHLKVPDRHSNLIGAPTWSRHIHPFVG